MEWRQLYTRTNTILFILFTRISLYWFSVISMHVHTRSADCHSTHCTHDQWWLPGSEACEYKVTNAKSECVHSSVAMHTANANRPGSPNLGFDGTRTAVLAGGWNCDGGITVLGQARSVGWHPESRPTSRAATRGVRRAVGSLYIALRAPSPAELVSTASASGHASTAGRGHGVGSPSCPPPPSHRQPRCRPTQRLVEPPPE
jgi:hypothetical protein